MKLHGLQHIERWGISGLSRGNLLHVYTILRTRGNEHIQSFCSKVHVDAGGYLKIAGQDVDKASHPLIPFELVNGASSWSNIQWPCDIPFSCRTPKWLHTLEGVSSTPEELTYWIEWWHLLQVGKSFHSWSNPHSNCSHVCGKYCFLPSTVEILALTMQYMSRAIA